MSEDMMEQNPKFSCKKTDEELYKMGYERARSEGYTGLRADIFAENFVEGYKKGCAEILAEVREIIAHDLMEQHPEYSREQAEQEAEAILMQKYS